jgi:hypothetical protein
MVDRYPLPSSSVESVTASSITGSASALFAYDFDTMGSAYDFDIMGFAYDFDIMGSALFPAFLSVSYSAISH